MEFKRETYLNQLVIRKNNGMVKVITGLRRCGKSYLLNKIFYSYLLSQGVSEDHIIRFAFDSADDLKKIGENLLELEAKNQKVDPEKFMSFLQGKINDENMYYLLLDEVQNLGSFESVLNSYLRKDNLDIYVTGSNSRFLSSDVLTEFEGRGDEIHLLPLSFSEYFSSFQGTKDEAYEQYSMYGGLPFVASMATDSQKEDHLTSLLSKVYLKDIIQHNHLKKDTNISELLDVIASGISSFTNPSKLEATFKSVKKVSLSRITIDTYVDYFMDSFLLSKSIKFDIKGKRYIDTPYKLYFEDIGLRNAAIGFRQHEETHLMENILYNELRHRGYRVDVGIVEAKGKEGDKQVRKQFEVDFVASRGSKKYYIQSAFALPNEEKWIQETNSFRRINDSFKKIIVVKNPVIPHYDEKGYLIVGLYEFLLNERSLEL